MCRTHRHRLPAEGCRADLRPRGMASNRAADRSHLAWVTWLRRIGGLQPNGGGCRALWAGARKTAWPKVTARIESLAARTMADIARPVSQGRCCSRSPPRSLPGGRRGGSGQSGSEPATTRLMPACLLVAGSAACDYWGRGSLMALADPWCGAADDRIAVGWLGHGRRRGLRRGRPGRFRVTMHEGTRREDRIGRGGAGHQCGRAALGPRAGRRVRPGDDCRTRPVGGVRAGPQEGAAGARPMRCCHTAPGSSAGCSLACSLTALEAR